MAIGPAPGRFALNPARTGASSGADSELMADISKQDGALPRVDNLSAEVSLRAQLDASGLTLAGKSRTLAAIDQLVSGLVGMLGYPELTQKV